MSGIVAIRRETKSTWERRSPLTPEAVRRQIAAHDLDFLVQPSARRVFPDSEYTRAGANLTTNLGDADVVLGVKEIPPELLEADTAYVYFSHVIKGQSQNMPALARHLELGSTLIDYEMIKDESSRRLIFFGRFAGLAGMIDSLWALGQRFRREGVRNPFEQIQPAHAYGSLAEAQTALRACGAAIEKNGTAEPIVIGVAGYGNVASGAREIVAELPFQEIEPDDLERVTRSASTSTQQVYVCTFKEKDLVEPIDASTEFDLQDYYDNPERYRGVFSDALNHLTVLVNGIYWEERYPRLVCLDDISRLWTSNNSPRLRVIGDLGCDVGGAVQCTTKTTDPANPVFVYDARSGESVDGFDGDGPVVLAVDFLPTELPLEASESFSRVLAPLVPRLARADYTQSFEALALPPELKRAVITHRGDLTPTFRYLEAHLTQL